MRLSLVLLLLALAGVLGGGALVGTWCLGVCLILDSLAVGWWALMRDDGAPVPGVHAVPGAGATLAQILERARAS
jgi:hypothetical protein